MNIIWTMGWLFSGSPHRQNKVRNQRLCSMGTKRRLFWRSLIRHGTQWRLSLSWVWQLNTSNPSTREAEAGRFLRVWGQLGLQRPCFKATKTKQGKPEEEEKCPSHIATKNYPLLVLLWLGCPGLILNSIWNSLKSKRITHYILICTECVVIVLKLGVGCAVWLAGGNRSHQPRLRVGKDSAVTEGSRSVIPSDLASAQQFLLIGLTGGPGQFLSRCWTYRNDKYAGSSWDGLLWCFRECL